MRQILLASAAVILAGYGAAAQSVTTYVAAPGQAALALEPFQSNLPGAKRVDLTVGVGSAAFRDPKGQANTIFTLGDRGANFTCDEAKEIIGGYAFVEAASKADAIRMATEFIEVHFRAGVMNVDVEVREVVGGPDMA